MMQQFLQNSYLFGGNAPFVEELYEKYLVNPGAVPEEWREYFDRMQMLPGSSGNGGRSLSSPSGAPPSTHSESSSISS